MPWPAQQGVSPKARRSQKDRHCVACLPKGKARFSTAAGLGSRHAHTGQPEGPKDREYLAASFQMNINKAFDELTGIHHRRKRVRLPPKIRPHFHGKGTPISDFGQRLKRFLKWNITFLKRYTSDDPAFGILDMELNQMVFCQS